jgi:3-oxoadipate enol-lactonase
MHYAAAPDGTRIHFEVSGSASAEPLLMIQGLGADARGWLLQRRALGRRFRVITFDNRGVGRSDKPDGPYDLEVMASDAVAVIEAAGVSSAHVMGASMGGVIAQILGVRHPARVRSLVLACTACRHEPWRVELLQDWADTALTKGMRTLGNRSLRWLVGSRMRRRLSLSANLLAPLVSSATPATFAAQVGAILSMDDSMRDELALIAVPTLVVVGSQDILTPMGDSEELAERIPGAELAVLAGAAHGVMVEQAGAFNRLVADFLDRASGFSLLETA